MVNIIGSGKTDKTQNQISCVSAEQCKMCIMCDVIVQYVYSCFINRSDEVLYMFNYQHSYQHHVTRCMH